jgi:TRAP-type C4-dicarboxylate transport system substrate-binding protein
MTTRALVTAAALALALLAPRVARAEPTTLRIGTLAPAESPWGQIFKVWQKGVAERTQGALELQFFWNGVQGDETVMVGKMRSGQLDAAALSAMGLSRIYPHVLVLQFPGLFTTWEKLDKARAALRPQLDAEFEKAGFHIGGWGDVGIAHTMSRGFPVRVPADLKHRKTFYFAGDPVAPTVFSVIGDVTPRQLTVPEILPALMNNTIEVLTSPALAAEQLQWAPRLDHIVTRPSGIGVGAFIYNASKVKSLPADVQAILFETGRVAGEALSNRVRREDAAAYARLKGRMTAYEPTDADVAQWRAVFVQVAQRLRGAHFDAKLFDAALSQAGFEPQQRAP